MKRYILLSIFTLLTVAYAIAGNNKAIAQAAAFYKDGKYAEAISLYDSIMKKEGSSAQLLFNMGNAYVKSDKLGMAMVCYQQAHALAPANSIITNNINYLSDKIEDRNKAKLGGKNYDVSAESPSFMKSVSLKISNGVSPDAWGYAAIAAFILLLAGIALYIFSANVLSRKVGFFGAIICLFFTVLFNLFTFVSRSYWTHRNECVVTAYEATILPEAKEDAKAEVTPIVEGTLLQVISDDATPKGWIKVKLNATFVGYLQQSQVVVL
jgi:tetratricopeptide (TPR) repeat protein